MDENLLAAFNYLYAGKIQSALAKFKDIVTTTPYALTTPAYREKAKIGYVLALLENGELTKASEVIDNYHEIYALSKSLLAISWMIHYEAGNAEAMAKIRITLKELKYPLSNLSNYKNLPAKTMARVVVIDCLCDANPNLVGWLQEAIDKQSPEAQCILAMGQFALINGNLSQGEAYLTLSAQAQLPIAVFLRAYLKICTLKQDSSSEEILQAITLAENTLTIIGKDTAFHFETQLLQALICYWNHNNAACLEILANLKSESYAIDLVYTGLLIQGKLIAQNIPEALSLLNNIHTHEKTAPPPLVILVLLIKILAHRSTALAPTLSLLQNEAIKNLYKMLLVTNFGMDLADLFHPQMLKAVRENHPANTVDMLITDLTTFIKGAPEGFGCKIIFQQILKVINDPPVPEAAQQGKKAAIKEESPSKKGILNKAKQQSHKDTAKKEYPSKKGIFSKRIQAAKKAVSHIPFKKPG